MITRTYVAYVQAWMNWERAMFLWMEGDPDAVAKSTEMVLKRTRVVEDRLEQRTRRRWPGRPVN
jgi:hypothetical protein